MSKFTAEELANTYINALKEIGIAAEKDNEDDVVFKHADTGSTLFFSLDAKDDPEFMRLVLPNFYSNADEGLVLRAINETHRSNKGVKLTARERDGEYNVTAAIECFVAGPDEMPTQEFLVATLRRSISAIFAGAKKCIENAKSLENSI